MSNENPREFSAKRVTFFGDWHGNMPFAVNAVRAAHSVAGSDLYIHVGDFGFWKTDSEECDHPEFLPQLERELAAQGKYLLFVDGNHEDHLWLNGLPLDEHGLRPITEHIFHIPRGAAFLVEGKRFVGLGGARSIDRAFRVKNETWFPEELITTEDLARAEVHQEASVLITHEAPETPWLNGRNIDAVTEISSQEQRHFVASARRTLQPQLLVHGHHHRRYTSQMGRTRVVGLGCDSWPLIRGTLDNNALHLDMEQLS